MNACYCFAYCFEAILHTFRCRAGHAGRGTAASRVLLEVNAFEALYKYTREHEDWDLDQWSMVFLASLFSILLAGAGIVLGYYHSKLRRLPS
jgi:hypothetical protein